MPWAPGHCYQLCTLAPGVHAGHHCHREGQAVWVVTTCCLEGHAHHKVSMGGQWGGALVTGRCPLGLHSPVKRGQISRSQRFSQGDLKHRSGPGRSLARLPLARSKG